MIKHIFIAPIKEDVSEAQIEKRMNDMWSLKLHIKEIKDLYVGKSLDLLGITHSVVLIADFESQEDWRAFIENDYHKELGKTDSLYFEVEKLICTQIEI